MTCEKYRNKAGMKIYVCKKTTLLRNHDGKGQEDHTTFTVCVCMCVYNHDTVLVNYIREETFTNLVASVVHVIAEVCQLYRKR